MDASTQERQQFIGNPLTFHFCTVRFASAGSLAVDSGSQPRLANETLRNARADRGENDDRSCIKPIARYHESPCGWLSGAVLAQGMQCRSCTWFCNERAGRHWLVFMVLKQGVGR
jgi:hypothetical protein